MALVRDPLDMRALDRESGEPLPFKRRLVIAGLALFLGEALLIALPLWSLFEVRLVPSGTLWRVALPIVVGAAVVWTAAFTTWILPIRTAVLLRRRGDRVARDLAARAYRATLRLPLRVLLLRTSLWSGSSAIFGAFLARYGVWPTTRVAELASTAAMHALLLGAVRGVWLASIMTGVRQRLFAVTPPLRRFTDSYFRRLVLVGIVVAAGTLAAQAAFLYYFVPISHAQYLQMQTYTPVAVAVGLVGWTLIARLLIQEFHGTLEAAQGDGEPAAGQNATIVYRKAQALPYRLALIGLGMWAVIALVGGGIARLHLRLEIDDAAIITAVMIVASLGAAIYELLWHRETMQPLLQYLTVRYRVPVRGVEPSLSLRSKLLLSLGGVVMLACGLALLWGFVQYKSLATEASARQADLGLSWLRSEVQAAAATRPSAPDPALVHAVMRNVGLQGTEASAVAYYIDDQGPLRRVDEVLASTGSDQVVAVGGGPMGAPRLPWYVAAQMRKREGAAITLGANELAGRARRLTVTWHGRSYDLGAVAVLYPSYRGRGPSMVRPLKELLVFFVVLFGACAGIVAVTVAQFVAPIRGLEQRANAMARGELADPVTSGSEGDEVGRLSFALEEMRRALRDRLRSTEEVNLDLERAVQMRTADLARKNKELAETLDKLTRAQAQLVRSEKMASIGQLVAGIAHEINNPVNAIVNTVGPLEESVADLGSDDAARRDEVASDIRDMVKVMQRGAQRTKAIVQALHNYSRTDDEHVVDFDLDRSLDDSLELLRHVLKQHVTVERRYGDVGRVRGHAGQIGQVFMNLLTNAAQALAGQNDARITIDTRASGDAVVVRIGDNGPGIPADVLPRIWDPFFTTKEVGEGTGLGLSIVHELVARHGGTIEVDTHVGAGTAFTVTLPRRAS